MREITSKTLFSFQEYAVKGNKALSVVSDIRDMAQFYAECPEMAGTDYGSWSSAKASKYITERVRDAEEALRVVREFEFPQAVRLEAKRHARTLTGVFQEVVQRVTFHDQLNGRLDRHKLNKVAFQTVLGTYDANQVRPYQRTVQAPAKPPTIAIVASAGNGEMWDDATYIPRVVELSLALVWACEAAGLRTYSALTSGHVHPHGYRHAELAVMLAKPGERFSPSTYAVALHRDLWRCAKMVLRAADFDSTKRLSQVAGVSATGWNIGSMFPSYTGGYGVRWAQETLKPDMVIGIGKLTDLAQADIQLGSQFSIGEAVKDVAAQAKKLKGGR